MVYLTFYGYDDNDDGAGHYGTNVISNPIIHAYACEDLGTYDCPGTAACDLRFLKAGTRIYVPRLQRYYIIEDTCVECSQDWTRGVLHVDLYINGTGHKLAACEDKLTLDGKEKVYINPSPNLRVDQRPALARCP